MRIPTRLERRDQLPLLALVRRAQRLLRRHRNVTPLLCGVEAGPACWPEVLPADVAIRAAVRWSSA